MTEGYPNSETQDAAELDSATHRDAAAPPRRPILWWPFRRLAAHYIEQLFHLEPLDSNDYPDIARIVAETATRLNLPAIKLCQLVESKYDIVVPIGIIPPDTLFLDLDLFGQLSADEQKAIINHELTHLTQPIADVTMGKLFATTAHAAKTALDSRHTPKGERISQWLDTIIERGIGKVADAEHEADTNGAAATSIETMKRAVVKLLVLSLEAQGVVIECDLDQPMDVIATELDKLLPATPADKIVNGGSWSERFAALDTASGELHQPSSRNL